MAPTVSDTRAAPPVPALAGVVHPQPVMAAVRERIEALSLQVTLDKLDAEMRQKYKDHFPLTLPDITNDLPDHIFHRIKLKDPDLVIKQRAYAAPKKYHEPWKRVLEQHLAAGRIPALLVLLLLPRLLHSQILRRRSGSFN